GQPISLAAAASLSVHVTGTTSAADTDATTYKGTLPNTATVGASNENSGNTANNTSSATVTVQAPDVKVVKTADASPINAGATAGFTVTVSNIGLGTASGVTLTDALPVGLGNDIQWAIAADSVNAAAFKITTTGTLGQPGYAQSLTLAG